MKNEITRRDFLNGTQIAVGAALTAPILNACGVKTTDFKLDYTYYPPIKTGLRGSHDGSWETMHARVSGQKFKTKSIEASYDLVIVGAGISGLAAAYFYREKRPEAKILILDNHDDVGGHAKRNEFEINGKTRIGYGGTESIDTPSHYAPPAKTLLSALGIQTKKFYNYFDQKLYKSMGLSKSIVFDQQSFGKEKLVHGYGKRDWTAFAADMPLSEKARSDFIRVQTENKDYMPGLSFDEKYEILRKTSYEDFLRNYARVDEQVIDIYKRWGMSFWCVGIDEIPTTLIQNYDGGLPGVTATLPRTGHRNNEPYIFHFPDGNASVVRLLVRALLPEAVPGSTMEDVVTTKMKYENLDLLTQITHIRLNSTAVNVENTQDGKFANVTYVRQGRTHTVQTNKCIMACYNSAIPYLCPTMTEEQKAGLAYNVKVPLVYTKILVPNWKPFAELGMDFVYYTGGFYKQVELAYPVSIGDYTKSESPENPMILHMCHVPWIPDTKGPDQWRKGRMKVLSTSFDEFENHAKTQLNQALSSTGFNADSDISAITVNRWPHGYSYSPHLIWEPDWKSDGEKPWVIGRQAFGNIHIANSDAGAGADTNTAIVQAHRAVSEIINS